MGGRRISEDQAQASRRISCGGGGGNASWIVDGGTGYDRTGHSRKHVEGKGVHGSVWSGPNDGMPVGSCE